MKNETKLKKLMSFLDENGIKYTTPRKRKEGSAHLFIGQYMIAVKIEGEDDTLFFNKHKRGSILSLSELRRHRNTSSKRCRI